MSYHSKNWDQRFSQHAFLYGTEPNDFLASHVDLYRKFTNALCLAEGQGRNAVWLAKLGLKVTAVDFSAVGLKTAAEFAAANQVVIETVLADLTEYPIQENHWDLIVSIWCHLPSADRKSVYRRVVDGLKPGGLLVIEAYTPDQIARGTGGPKDPDMLPTLSQLREELAGMELLIGHEIVRDVQEGTLHIGISSVVQVLARKL